MDHAATMRRVYDLLNAGDIDGFGDLLAPDVVEHEELPGLTGPYSHVWAMSAETNYFVYNGS